MATKDVSFDIFLSDYTSSIDEWRRAQEAPVSELPDLNEEQKEVARKFKISREEYARGVLAGQYGQKRMKVRTRNLGELVQRMVEDLGKAYRVAAIAAEMFRGRWVVRVETPRGYVNVSIPRELGDDVLDSATREEIEKLRSRLRYGLGLDELSVRPE